jgi:P27 family predicted phage terminase small subunit
MVSLKTMSGLDALQFLNRCWLACGRRPRLRLYCEAWSRYRQAVDMLAGSAPLLNDRGHLAKNPLHQVVRDNADHVRLLARELGLSPAARASLQLMPGGG